MTIDLSMQKPIGDYPTARDVTVPINLMDDCLDEQKRLEQTF